VASDRAPRLTRALGFAILNPAAEEPIAEFIPTEA
jgi:hypothetical protein